MPKFVYWFDQLDRSDGSRFGEKAALLADLKKSGISINEGFVLSPKAYFEFLESGHLREKINKLLGSVVKSDKTVKEESLRLVRDAINSKPLPRQVVEEIQKNVRKLATEKTNDLELTYSFGPEESVRTASKLTQSVVSNKKTLIDFLRKLWGNYLETGFLENDQLETLNLCGRGVAIIFNQSIQPESSGMVYTKDPSLTEKSRLLVAAKWGLVGPKQGEHQYFDNYEVDKINLEIIFKNIFSQQSQLVQIEGKLKNVPVAKSFASIQKLSDKNILELARIGKQLESRFGFPQEISWFISRDRIFVSDTRQFHLAADLQTQTQGRIGEGLKLLIKGSPAFPGIATGIPRIIKNQKDLSKLKNGDILITDAINKEFPRIKKPAAIVTNGSGSYSQASLISKKLGIPCVIDIENITDFFNNFHYAITVNGATGQIFSGGLSPSQKSSISYHVAQKRRSDNPGPSAQTATKIFVTIGERDLASELAGKEVDGIGMLKSEIIFSEIGIHPKKFISDKKQKVFIDKLASFISTFTAAFDPRPVIYKSSDLRSDEYRNLKWGEKYESFEPNPLLGTRGGSRYVINPEEFELELEAIKTVRNKFGHKNLWLMLPFVRTVSEMEKIRKIISSSGLHKSDTFKTILLANIPANVLLVEKYLQTGIDGVAVSLDDLITFTLGVDRTNSDITKKFNELDPAVVLSLEKVIRACSQKNLYSSVIGQAPSLYPELAEKLIEWGISSVSVSALSVERTKKIVSEAEKKFLSSKSHS